MPRAPADSAQGMRGVVPRPGNAAPPAALVGLGPGSGVGLGLNAGASVSASESPVLPSDGGIRSQPP
jgi:hypothetical protein